MSGLILSFFLLYVHGVYISSLKGYLSFVWISIEQSVMVSGIVYVFLILLTIG